MKFLKSTDKAAAKTEIAQAYIQRIKAMSQHGEDSPEGLLAEAAADEKAFEFEDKYGHPYSR